MVRQSDFVILDCSTAINFGVLFEKPLVFVSYNFLDNLYEGSLVKFFSSKFGKIPHNIDRPLKIDWREELVVSREIYQKYVEEYIKTEESPEIPFWEISARKIKNFRYENQK